MFFSRIKWGLVLPVVLAYILGTSIPSFSQQEVEAKLPPTDTTIGVIVNTPKKSENMPESKTSCPDIKETKLISKCHLEDAIETYEDGDPLFLALFQILYDYKSNHKNIDNDTYIIDGNAVREMFKQRGVFFGKYNSKDKAGNITGYYTKVPLNFKKFSVNINNDLITIKMEYETKQSKFLYSLPKTVEAQLNVYEIDPVSAMDEYLMKMRYGEGYSKLSVLGLRVEEFKINILKEEGGISEVEIPFFDNLF